MSAARHVPSVALVVELEANPRIVFNAATNADRQALHVWLTAVRPDIDNFLRGIAREIHERNAA